MSEEGKNQTETLVRALIAAIVIGITAFLTWDGADVAQEWQAVFVMVIGYYFKDRPQQDRLRLSLSVAPTGSDTERKEVVAPIKRLDPVMLEIGTQFVLALGLLVATVVCFTVRHIFLDLGQPKQHILTVPNALTGAWIGGVTVAIAFYFKSSELPTSRASIEHDFFRALLATAVAVSTLVIFLARKGDAHTWPKDISTLPLQWIALAFIVITFYFKERESS